MRFVAVFFMLISAMHVAPALAEKLRIGLLHTLSPAPLYLAMARGYFAQAGLDAQFTFFEAAQPIAAAAVSGDIDVGITALTGGFFNLAERGALKVIGGGLYEEPGFEGTALIVSNQAFAAGLTTAKELGGHTLGITQYGSSFHYMAGRVAEREAIDPARITLRPLQTIGNMMAAVRTGQVDATMAIASMAKPAATAGEVHIVAWLGDLVPYQITAVFAPARMAAERPETLTKFAQAYRRGVADYRQAFLRKAADGTPVHDAATDAAIADIEKFVFTGDPAAREKILDGLGYYPADGALDAKDVAAQLQWFEAQGLVKGNLSAEEVIDGRFLPVQK